MINHIYYIPLGVLAIFVFLYCLALPKPIPGIPYNKTAARSVLGDLPSLIRWKKVTRSKDMSVWVSLQLQHLDSPIAQVFITPFKRPTIIVKDAQATQDALAKVKEFDRSRLGEEWMAMTTPNALIVKSTGDEWRARKKMKTDMITPGFIADIVAPRDFESALTLVRLWRMKANIAKDRLFDLRADIEGAIFDGLWNTLHADRTGIIESEVNHLKNNPITSAPSTTAGLVSFPSPKEHVLLVAFEAFRMAVMKAITSPSTRIANLITSLTPSYWRAIRVRRAIVGNLLARSQAKFRANPSATPNSALDWTVLRAAEINAKTGYTVSDDHMLEETAENISASWLTTSASTQWTLKRLMSSTDVQARLRDELHRELGSDFLAAMVTPDAVLHADTNVHIRETSARILKANLPYLDAVVEESLRIGLVVAMLTRTAIVDTTVLGHAIPKGSEFYFTLDSFNLSAKDSSNSKKRAWDASDLAVFNPDRWLVTDKETGKVTYDPSAGPFQSFGGGIRGCLGKKLAYARLGIYIATFVGAFEFGTIDGDEKALTDEQRQWVGFEGDMALSRRPVWCVGKLKAVDSVL